jgi:hypothetical protein
MSTYAVIRKSDQQQVYEYQTDTPVEWVDFPFADFDHVELQDAAATEIPPTKFDGRRILTKLEFRSLFSDATLKWIDRFEAQFEDYAYLTDAQKDSIRTAFKDYHEATFVDLDDPRWVPGLSMYVALGGMDADEVTEVLRG